MQSVYEIRRTNLRSLMTQWGGPTSLSRKLGHANGSYLAQLIGPHPSREISEKVARELKRITDMAALAAKNGIEPHAGHGLTFENVQPIAAIPQIAELNIGHYLIGEAVFLGLGPAIEEMRRRMERARGF